MALVDRDEKLHGECVAALEKWTGSVVTTEAVLTETLYLVGPVLARRKKLVLSFPERRFSIGSFVGEKFAAGRGSDGKVSKRPDGFRGRHLGCIGGGAGNRWIFTLDRRGFATYRMNRNRTFQIIP